MTDGDRGTGLMVITGSGISDKHYLPTIAMVCNKCGYLRTHAAKHFLSWKLEQTEGQDASDTDTQGQ